MRRLPGWVNRFAPRWLRIFLVGIAAAVALSLALPYSLDVDRHRPLLASAIEGETGRKVTLGKLRVRLLPSVGFVLENFTLSNPPGFAEGNLLSVAAVRGNLAWGPLLRREFQLRSVELVRPKLMLLEDDRSQINYDFTRKSAPRPSPGQASRTAHIARVKLTDAELTLARVTGGERRIVPSLRARKINAALGDVAFDSRLLKEWKADADLAGVRLELPGLKGPIEFRSGRFTLRNAGVESEFEADLGQAARMKGSLRVADIERPVAIFEVSTPLVDLDQLGVTGARTGTPRSLPTEFAESLPRKSRELVAQGRLAAERVRWAPYEGSEASAQVRIFTDRVEVWPVMMAFYGGSLGVSAWLERYPEAAGPERFSSNIEVRNLDVGKILAVLPATRGKMNGTGELTLQLFGSLGPGWMNSLAGTGTFAVRDGRFPGFHLGDTIQALVKVQRVFNLGKSGATFFTLISGDLAISQGRVRSQRIHLDSPSGTVDLNGGFGFAGTLDYDGLAVLVPGSAGGSKRPANILTGVLGGVIGRRGGRIRVPFALRGTFREPRIQPGRSFPSFRTASPTQPTAAQPENKKSILDLFRRP